MDLTPFLARIPEEPNEEAFAAFQAIPWDDIIPNLIYNEQRISLTARHQKSPLIAKSHDTLILAITKAFTLQLSSLEPDLVPASTIETLAGPTYLRILGKGSLTLQSYALPEGFENSVFRDDRPLKEGPLITIQAHESKPLDPLNGAWTPCAREGRPALLRLVWKPTTDLVWHFCSKSLHPRFCSASRSCDSRAQFILQFLAQSGKDRLNEPMLDLIMRLSRHASYFVRWEAVTCLMKLRPELGLSMVKERLQDEHPEVRFAAQDLLRQTLEVGHGQAL